MRITSGIIVFFWPPFSKRKAVDCDVYCVARTVVAGVDPCDNPRPTLTVIKEKTIPYNERER